MTPDLLTSDLPTPDLLTSDLPTSDATLDPTAVAALRRRIDGETLLPGDIGYAAACSGFNLTFSNRPAVVVSARHVQDVVEAVRFARAHGRSVAVQATGHGLARLADGGILISTKDMTEVRIDPEARRAWIGAGTTWAPVLAAAQEHGLAPLLGSSPLVGAVGYTLGGGMGWLARAHGLSCDKVVRFEVVTADGEVREASADENPELFFALRGAGAGSLGVVTGMEIELVSVTTVYAGNLFYPASMAAEVMTRWRAWLPQVPDELTSAVTLMNFPPFEEVPAPVRGRSFVIVRGCYAGDLADGEQLMAHWREWCTPELDMFGPLPFTRAAEISNDPVDPMPAMSTGAWLRDLDATAIDALVTGTYPVGGPPALIMTELRHAGGAIARPTGAPSAVGNRDALLSLQMVGVTPTPESAAFLEAHTTAMKAALGACRSEGVYLNWLEGLEKRNSLRAGVGDETAARLAQLKAALDPGDLFDRGLNLRAEAR